MTETLERRAATLEGVRGERIIGHAVVFDTPSRDLGGFVEIVRPGAVDRALRAEADIVALYNHDPGAVLGRTPHSLRLARDSRGLAFELEPADTQQGRDVLTLVSRGDLRGASFGFRALKDAWRTEGRTVIRELLEIDILEISVTAFPAYQVTDVQVAQRALQAFTQQRQGSRIAWLRGRLSMGGRTTVR